MPFTCQVRTGQGPGESWDWVTPVQWTCSAIATTEGTPRDPAARRRADAQSTPRGMKLLTSLGGQLGTWTSGGRDRRQQQSSARAGPRRAEAVFCTACTAVGAALTPAPRQFVPSIRLLLGGSYRSLPIALRLPASI